MGVFIELFLVFLAFCWVAGEGVPWTLVAVPAYLGLLSLKITPLGRKIKRTRTFLAFVTVFAFVAVGAGAVAFRVLSQPVGSIASSPVFDFLAGPMLLKLFWSGVIGLLVGVEVLALALIPIGMLVAHGKYGDFEQYKAHKAQATRTAIYGFLGISKGTWEVREGKLEVLDKPDGSLARFGGPGELIVQLGHAVLLELNGQISDIVGSGVHFLKPFERVSMVVPLQARREPVVVRQVVTKDQVTIDEIECWVFHKVDLGPDDDKANRVKDEHYAYNRRVLRELVWSTSGNDWRSAVQSIGASAVRNVVGQHNLDEIVPLVDRKEFSKELLDATNAVTKVALGVVATAFGVDSVTIPVQAQEQLLQVKLSEWAVRIAENHKQEAALRGEAEAETLRAVENARANAQNRMIRAIREAFEHGGSKGQPDPSVVVNLRYIEALENMSADPSARSALLSQVPFTDSGRMWYAPDESGAEGVDSHSRSQARRWFTKK